MSDAAPLPRLGEVFFDVRGNSRSMRLSWYADTGVAVFSIWQAGMCTGTFRLPIGDLSRMIEILERGPSPQGRGRAPVSAGRRGPEGGRGDYPDDGDEIGLLDSDGPAGQPGYAGAEYAADYGRSGRGPAGGGGTSEYPAADYGSAEYPAADYRSAEYPAADYGSAEYPAADYRSTDYPAADYGSPDHAQDGYGQAGHAQAGHADTARGSAAHAYGGTGRHGDDHSTASYQPADYGAGRSEAPEQAGYGRGSYAEDDPVRRGGHAAPDYAPGSYGGAPDYLTGEHTAAGYRDETRTDTGADYLSGGYGSQPAFPASGRRRDDRRLPPDTGGLPSAETDGTGYREERFVPPYVQGGSESYLNDNRAREAGYEGDPDYAGYPPDAPPVSPSDGYPDERRPGEAYSYGSEYRRR